MAATLDTVIAEIQQHPTARPVQTDSRTRPRWPMIILRTPKGWTGPKVVDGKPDRGNIPLPPSADGRNGIKARTFAAAGKWMRSYRPEELFDENGQAATGTCRTGTEGRAPDGGQSTCEWRSAIAGSAAAGFSRLCSRSVKPGAVSAEAPVSWGISLRDVMQAQPDSEFPRLRPR